MASTSSGGRFQKRFSRNNSYETRKSEWKTVFDKYDVNRDGFISICELDELIQGQNYEHDLPEHVIEKIHGLADTDNDGQLDFKEFIVLINHPAMQPIFGNMVNKYVQMMVPQATTRYRGQYEDQFRCCPPPIVMIVISIIEIMFFAIDEATKHSSDEMSGAVAEVLIYDPTKRSEVWRYFTYMFVHIGVLHLVVNVLVQVMLGTPLEMVHRWWRVCIIYCSGVLAGSLATSITDPSTKLAGASGGVYALITAHISSIIMNWKEMEYPAIQLLIFTIITVCDIGKSIYDRYVLQQNLHIGYAAHFAGALAGLLVSINVVRNINVTRTEKFLWWIAIIVYVLLMGTAIVWNIGFPSYFPKPT